MAVGMTWQRIDRGREQLFLVPFVQPSYGIRPWSIGC